MARSLVLARMLHDPSVAHLVDLLRRHVPLDQAAACLNVAPLSLHALLEEQTALEADPHVVARAMHDEQGGDPPPIDTTPITHRLPPANPFTPTDQRETRGWQAAIRDLLQTTPDLPEELVVAIRTYQPKDPMLARAARMLPGIGWHEERVLAQADLPEHVAELSFELQVVLLKNIRKVERARGEAQAELTTYLAKEARGGNLRALTFLLERVDPKNWGPTSPRPPANPNASYRMMPKPGTTAPKDVSQKNKEAVAGMTEEQIRERVETLLGKKPA